MINDLDASPAEQTVKDIKATGGEVVACLGSVTAPDFAERFIDTAVENYKGLDIIVNNAGYTWDNVIQKMTDEQWYAMIDIHLSAPFRILRAAQPVIRGLSKASANFISPATYSEHIEAYTSMKEVRGKSFILSHIIRRGVMVLAKGEEKRIKAVAIPRRFFRNGHEELNCSTHRYASCPTR